jgi:hypothetical protein
MGFISTLTVNNDFVHDLPKVGNLGKQIYEAVCRLSSEKPVHLNQLGITAVESHHADYAQPLLIGGWRESTIITGVSIPHHHGEESELKLLEQLAEKHGYNIYKKPQLSGKELRRRKASAKENK